MNLFTFPSFQSNKYILTYRPVSPNVDSRTYGVPSVRSDLPAPRIARVTDRINYGDKPSVADLLNPSVAALQGAYKEHFFCPRTKEEVGICCCVLE